MKSLAKPAVYWEVLDRLGDLTPDRQPRWGRMSAHQMLCHTGDQLCVALGDIPVQQTPRGPSATLVGRCVALYLPWPKQRLRAAAEFQLTAPTDWQTDMNRLWSLVERFARTDPSFRWGVHPLLGPLSGTQWGWLSYKHLDHHLRQFGI